HAPGNACRTRRDPFNEGRFVEGARDGDRPWSVAVPLVFMITVVDYKLNNLRSIENTLRRLGHDVKVTSNPDDVRTATKLILPGVGAFRDGVAILRQLWLFEPFVEKVKSGVPTLGICLGMHLLFTESEEFGLHRGLDLIPGRVVKLPSN